MTLKSGTENTYEGTFDAPAVDEPTAYSVVVSATDVRNKTAWAEAVTFQEGLVLRASDVSVSPSEGIGTSGGTIRITGYVDGSAQVKNVRAVITLIEPIGAVTMTLRPDSDRAYEGQYTLPAHSTPGTYTVVVKATDINDFTVSSTPTHFDVRTE
jgi:hypothetical protein